MKLVRLWASSRFTIATIRNASFGTGFCGEHLLGRAVNHVSQASSAKMRRIAFAWMAARHRFIRSSGTRNTDARPCARLTAEQKAEVAALVEKGPEAEKDGVVRWGCADLKRRIEEMFGIKLHERTVGKQLKALGYVRLLR